MMILGLLAAFAVFIGLFASAGRLAFLWLKLIGKSLSPLVFGISYGVVIVLVLAGFAVSRVPGIGVPRVLFRIGHYALGVVLYLMLFANCAGLLLYLGKWLRLIPAGLLPKVSAYTGAAVLLLIGALSIYGSLHAMAIKTRQYQVQLGSGQGETSTLRLTLVSDLHLGYVVEEAHLARIVAAINQTEPDLVCIAGDIFDGDITALANPQRLQQLLLQIESRYGVYACLGNHDAGSGYARMLAFLDGAKVKLLKDETVIIDHRLGLAGRRDSGPIGGQGEGRKALAASLAADALPLIVLDHRPENIREYGPETDLILCGHTHQGQMFPFNLVTNAAFDVDYGLYQAGDGPQVIVTSGAGTWGPPMRVAADSEIVSVKLILPSKEMPENSLR